MGRAEDTFITAVNGQPIAAGIAVDVDFGRVAMSERGTLNIIPATGLQMEPIWLPAPETVWARMGEIATTGYRNSTLAEHLGYSLFRVIVGFALGALVGIPLGYAMGLSNWFRGWSPTSRFPWCSIRPSGRSWKRGLNTPAGNVY